MADQANRPHRKPKEKKAHSGGPNPKAFAYAAPGRLAKQGARSQDVRRYVHIMFAHG
jgi:ribosome biogenesis protein BMS1